MFILVLKYISPLSEIDHAIPAHIEYLNKYYGLSKFICSGRQVPRKGGIILCTAKDICEVETIIKEDPFNDKKLAEYEIIEFSPSKYADELKPLLG
ncbi:MAG: YciI family protein [Pelosinus sp.]|nr:YciI family protein [Pelosinus sp.]